MSASSHFSDFSFFEYKKKTVFVLVVSLPKSLNLRSMLRYKDEKTLPLSENYVILLDVRNFRSFPFTRCKPAETEFLRSRTEWDYRFLIIWVFWQQNSAAELLTFTFLGLSNLNLSELTFLSRWLFWIRISFLNCTMCFRHNILLSDYQLFIIFKEVKIIGRVRHLLTHYLNQARQTILLNDITTKSFLIHSKTPYSVFKMAISRIIGK